MFVKIKINTRLYTDKGYNMRHREGGEAVEEVKEDNKKWLPLISALIQLAIAIKQLLNQ